jgi:hypothetical protein
MLVELTEMAYASWRKSERLVEFVVILPYLGLCFPAVYAPPSRSILVLVSQFAWAVLSSALMGLVYKRLTP